jgi:hypothetical protein
MAKLAKRSVYRVGNLPWAEPGMPQRQSGGCQRRWTCSTQVCDPRPKCVQEVAKRQPQVVRDTSKQGAMCACQFFNFLHFSDLNSIFCMRLGIYLGLLKFIETKNWSIAVWAACVKIFFLKLIFSFG